MSGHFKKGIWHEFDLNGNLTRTIDHDEPYKYSFEDVLLFCKKEHISVEKGILPTPSGHHTTISRTEDLGSPIWLIDWVKTEDIGESIKLDGMTGKVLEKEEYNYINN
jgi:hypothetical protein